MHALCAGDVNGRGGSGGKSEQATERQEAGEFFVVHDAAHTMNGTRYSAQPAASTQRSAMLVLRMGNMMVSGCDGRTLAREKKNCKW
jgi:hypothetical protein